MALDKKQLEEMYLRMCRIRYFEEAVIEIHSSGELIGPAHPYIGEEAVAVGACAALRDDDRIAARAGIDAVAVQGAPELIGLGRFDRTRGCIGHNVAAEDHVAMDAVSFVRERVLVSDEAGK